MNYVTVYLFATLKERAGVKEIQLEVTDGALVRDVKKILLERFPGLAGVMNTALVAVNHEYAQDDVAIPQNAEIALFPPVSGGAQGGGSGMELGRSDQALLPTVFAITEEELDLNSLLAQITLPTSGAACFFTGMVRAVTRRDKPHETTYLEYEAYQPMAEAKMSQVVHEIRARWPAIEGIAIVQRIGRLEPGTPTVLIACTAAHRDTGVFEAARYGIDRLKEIVPVWKREVGPHGEMWIEGDYIPKMGE